MTKISELPDAGPVNPTDLVELVQSGINVKAPASALAGGAVPGYIAHRSSPVDSPVWADEFSGTALDPAWGTVVPTGTLTPAVGRGVLSLACNAQAASDMAGIVRPLPGGITTKFAIETSYRMLTAYENYLMAGPFISDGVTATNNVMWWMPFLYAAATGTFSFRGGTITNVATNYGDRSMPHFPGMDLLFRMTVDLTAVTVRVEYSLDGVQWSLAGNTAFARALAFTPTHFGFGVSTWGGTSVAYTRLTSIDYIRIYAVA